MLSSINISAKDILQQVKLSCQIPAIVEQIAIRKLIISAAAEAQIEVDPKELQQAANNIRLVSKLRSADQTWAWLQKNSLSVDDFEEMVYTNVISGKLAQYLFGEQVEAWFFEHQLDYYRAVIYEIILEDEDLAMELFDQIQEGQMIFPEVAQKYIHEQELRRTGGYRGILNSKDMKPEISSAVFAAKPPQLLKPIVTAQGIHLILVEELIQPKLDDKLRYQINSDLFNIWIKEQLKEIVILKNIDTNS
ncbi:PpiC-type peptidyl-prolyl cis-trans isomerase [Tolypothrix tenuis PCC 7101]|uniref:peptidylprolyl isomerase n=2 Tax=Tolypothrix TaxID=111782 RepID=A0A1Z4N1Z4_9CYAN|nr:peptidylprolyl isomerase [Aulosira sp. FACHB-113]BAY99768.1 PpiC-type peptidyl-prolyl cis-trans isomerase [Tolypothrix tenuis PCC 7101]BAZ76310.1 PpiC-type peptidyl-prolyl cis-trans isomerase [Aulosira laxa NIES-50]